MITAFMLVTADRSHLAELGPRLAACEGVAEVYTTTGDVDFIVRIQVADLEELSVLVQDRLGRIEGILATKTHLAMRRFAPAEIAAAFDLGID